MVSGNSEQEWTSEVLICDYRTTQAGLIVHPRASGIWELDGMLHVPFALGHVHVFEYWRSNQKSVSCLTLAYNYLCYGLSN